MFFYAPLAIRCKARLFLLFFSENHMFLYKSHSTNPYEIDTEKQHLKFTIRQRNNILSYLTLNKGKA